MIEGVIVTDLNIISLDEGDVLHCMKKSDSGFEKYGEAYFSEVKPGAIKAWKRHNKMTLNLVVPVGEIKFVIYDDRLNSKTNGDFFEIILSRENYKRLTVQPGLWMAFQGIGNDLSMLLNIANIEHDFSEADRKNINEIKYGWD